MEVNIASLKESNDFLTTLLENITSAIFVVDKDIRIQNFNDSFHSLFYKKEDSVLGELCGNALGCIHAVENNADCGTTKNCIDCTLRLSLIETFIRKIPTHRAVLSREFYINDKIIHKHFQFSTRHIKYNTEEVILVIVDDITEGEEQKKALAEKNQRLTDLNLQKNELLGVAAHDLRNPLSVINSFSEILLEAVEDLKPENIKEILLIINKTSRFSLQLLNDLLDYSKIESGTLQLKKVRLNYFGFIKENISQNEFLSVQKSIPIELTASSEDLVFEFDPRRIDQVLNNLISNAIKYSFPGNGIKVSVFKENGFIATSVEDKGQGIPEKDLPHLFEPFRQVSVKATNNEKGSGLGLAIVKKILDVHNGHISVKSKPGEGSVFTFWLPE